MSQTELPALRRTTQSESLFCGSLFPNIVDKAVFAIKLPPQLNQVNSTRIRINTPSLTAGRGCASSRTTALIMKRSGQRGISFRKPMKPGLERWIFTGKASEFFFWISGCLSFTEFNHHRRGYRHCHRNNSPSSVSSSLFSLLCPF